MGDSTIQLGLSPVGMSVDLATERGDPVYRLTGFAEYSRRIGKRSSDFYWRVAPQYQMLLADNMQHIFAARGGVAHPWLGLEGLIGVTHQGNAVTGASLNAADLTRMIIPGIFIGYQAIWRDSPEHRLEMGVRWAWPVCFKRCPF